MLRHWSAGVENQALGVDQVYTLSRLFWREALQLEETEKLHSHANPSRSRAKEEDFMGCQGLARRSRRYFGSIKEAGQNNSASTLHVIVKHWITMTEGVQVVESMLSREVLQNV